MITNHRPYATALNCCRWLAALLVVLQHLRHMLFVEYGAVVNKNIGLQAFYFLTSLGTPAVMVFFVMSGLLVGGTTARKYQQGRYDAADYAIHRISRIYTVLLPALLIGGMLDVIGLWYFNDSQIYTNHRQYLSLPIGEIIGKTLNFGTFFGNVAMMQNWHVPVWGSNGPLWSLAYEWWYYCLFWAFLGAMSPRHSLAARCSYVAFAALLLIALPKEMLLWFGIWLLGVALAWSDAVRRKIHPVTGLLLFAAVLLGVRFTYTLKPFNVSDPLAVQFAKNLAIALAFGVLLLSLSRIRSFRLGSPRFHEAMAGFSYTTYLVHFPMTVLLVAVLHDRFGIAFARQPTIAAGVYFCLVLGALYLYSYLFATVTEHMTDRVRRALQRCWQFSGRLSPPQASVVEQERGSLIQQQLNG